MANIASLLKAQLATPERVLYRQFLEGGWRDISAREIAAYAARWQAFLRAEGLAPGARVRSRGARRRRPCHDLLHLGHCRQAEGGDAHARQHPRERLRLRAPAPRAE